MSRYDDIINLPHYEPKHPRMSLANRAAQFAPFAALTGHGDAISETARLTDRMIELTDEEQQQLTRKIGVACRKRLAVSITCFQPDPVKEGGCYICISGFIRNINFTDRNMILSDGRVIPLRFVVAISKSRKSD